MAKSVLDIVIKMVKEGSGDKDTVKELVNIKTAIGGAVTAFGVLAGAGAAVNAVYNQTLKVFIDYASKIRDFSQMTGLGAEQASKLVQAADDLDISFESLSKSLWNASKKGIDVSVESLASMADAFVAIESPAEQASFLAEKFGKSGADMAKLLKLGGDGVMEYVDSIEGSLVITEEQIRQSEMARLALDSMADAWEGVKVAVGSAIGEMIAASVTLEDQKNIYEDMTGVTLQFSRAQGEQTKNFEAFQAQLARGSAMTEYYNSQLENTATATDDVQVNYSELLGLTQNLSKENLSFAEKMTSLNAELEKLTTQQAKFKEGSTAWSDIQGDIDKTKDSISNLAQEHNRATNQMIFGLLQQKMAADGLSDAEYTALIKIGQGFGIIDQQSADAALAMNEFANSIVSNMDNAGASTTMTNERMAEIIKQAQELARLTGKPMKFFIDIAVNGSFPIPPNTTGSANKPRRQGGAAPEEMATGGQLGSGWTMVGEEGFELISPSGWVFTNEESRALLRSGLDPEYARALGGDLYTSNGITATSSGLKKSSSFKGGSKTASATRARNFANDTARLSAPSGGTVASEIGNAAQSIETSVTASTETAAAAAQTSVAVQQQMLQNTLQTTAAITQGNAEMVSQQQQTNALLRTMQSALPGQLVAAFVQANP